VNFRRICRISHPQHLTVSPAKTILGVRFFQFYTDGYGKDVRVIVSEEITKKRVHSKDGKGWEDTEEVANWMWATNLDLSGSIGDLKNTVRYATPGGILKTDALRKRQVPGMRSISIGTAVMPLWCFCCFYSARNTACVSL